ncbi:hypothetical protein A2U01_0086821, partial [Trifolium medium]|nr:hypothetical protein [Trifolium medium]
MFETTVSEVAIPTIYSETTAFDGGVSSARWEF